MKPSVAALCFLLTAVGSMSGRSVLADSADASPVAGATVFSSSGLILGMTDANGVLPPATAADFPLSVRSLGYESARFDTAADTLFLIPEAYSLGEIAVSAADRPVRRMVCRAREYTTGATTSDTLRMLSDCMVEMFFAEGKVKGYSSGDARPRIRAMKRYVSLGKNGGDGKKDEDGPMFFFLENMVSLPAEAVRETDAIRAGAPTDTIAGKYSPRTFLRKSGSVYRVTDDMLSDYKDHRWSPWFFKMLGMTMELTEARKGTAYADRGAGSGVYGVADLVSATYAMHTVGKGKWIRKAFRTDDAVDIDCYIELYPLEVTSLTVDEYKAMKKDRSPLEFRDPETPLPDIPGTGTLTAVGR